MNMITAPLTIECHQYFKKRNHICFGISPFNSYFSESRIATLAQWGKREFKSMHFFIPDVPSVFTLEALGYDSEKASWKARRQAQYLYNKTVKALRSVGIDSAEIEERIITWNSLIKNSAFIRIYNQVQDQFSIDEEFRNACLEASSWVLEGKLPTGTLITEAQKKLAVKYLLSEIPVFLNCSEIVGAESSVFSYHQHVPFIDRLFRGDFMCRKNGQQGFLVLKFPDGLEAYKSMPILEESL